MGQWVSYVDAKCHVAYLGCGGVRQGVMGCDVATGCDGVQQGAGGAQKVQ